MTGQQMYEAYRSSMRRCIRRRAFGHTVPRWKDLRPYLKRVWDEAAEELLPPGSRIMTQAEIDVVHSDGFRQGLS